MKKHIIIYMALAFVGLLSACKQKELQQKPNIVYVLVDQWRAQATGYNGDPNLIGKTPHLDKIANEGINFKNAISTKVGDALEVKRKDYSKTFVNNVSPEETDADT